MGRALGYASAPADLAHPCRRGLPISYKELWAEQEAARLVDRERSLKAGWMALLGGIPWDTFLTITYKRPRRDAWSAIRDAQAALYAMPGYSPGDRLFLGAEFHKSDNVHLHGLVAWSTREDVDHEREVAHLEWLAWANLFHTFGRSRLETPYQRQRANVESYVTKYCVKGLTEYLLV